MKQIYTNNKNDNEYRILWFGTYTNIHCPEDYNQDIIKGIDCTNKRVGKIVEIYYIFNNLGLLDFFVYTEDIDLNRTECIIYTTNELNSENIFVREIKEFSEKFTMKGGI